MRNLLPQISNNHIKNHKNNDTENTEHYYQTYANLSDIGSHFGTSCLKLYWGSAFCLRRVFRTLWGVPPWTDVDLLGAPSVRFSLLVGRV